MMINIYSDPMTAAQIKEAREMVSRGENLEDSVAFKVFMYCPVPIVDLAAGLATYAVESSVKGNPEAEWSYVSGAVDRDWSLSDATKDYVHKVKLQNRELVVTEVESLEQHLKIVAGADYAVGVAQEIAKSAFKGLFGK